MPTTSGLDATELQAEVDLRDQRIDDLTVELRMLRRQNLEYERRMEKLRKFPLWQPLRWVFGVVRWGR